MTTVCCVLLLAIGADDGLTDTIRQLGDDAVEVRDAAVRKLRARGRAIVPDLERALSEEQDAETRARLTAVLKFLTRVHWYTDLASARARAAAEKKPLLVFSTMGPLDGYV
jgi:hypothetical protein